MEVTLLTLISVILVISLLVVLINVFKDKKVSADEKVILRDIIISTLSSVIDLNSNKSEEEIHQYAIMLIMTKLKENNITGISVKTVTDMLSLLLLLNSTLAEKLKNKTISTDEVVEVKIVE